MMTGDEYVAFIKKFKNSCVLHGLNEKQTNQLTELTKDALVENNATISKFYQKLESGKQLNNKDLAMLLKDIKENNKFNKKQLEILEVIIKDNFLYDRTALGLVLRLIYGAVFLGSLIVIAHFSLTWAIVYLILNFGMGFFADKALKKLKENNLLNSQHVRDPDLK